MLNSDRVRFEVQWVTETILGTWVLQIFDWEKGLMVGVVWGKRTYAGGFILEHCFVKKDWRMKGAYTKAIEAIFSDENIGYLTTDIITVSSFGWVFNEEMNLYVLNRDSWGKYLQGRRTRV